MRTQAVKYSADSMAEFKKGIDKLITELDATMTLTAGPNSTVSAIDRSKFGGGGAAWAEAQSAYASYAKVRKSLVDLSKLLKDCLEGLGIAVVASQGGIEAMDEDIKLKMRGIYERTKDAHDKSQAQQQGAGQGKPADSGSEGTSGGDGGSYQ
ncbi:hypothetical protein ASE09_05315 [Streptomyces sp. Root66D1]|nr:hypothetical protein ASD33_05310 [Streptomyces sp. Root1304]KRA90561.1 hypothetical protein ASE09_05315 [Streptomyces sp. Root66D1]